MTNQPALNLALDTLEDAYGLNPPDDAIYEAFTAWTESTGRPLYPHQEEALLEAIDSRHLIVATPTGSGKSMVALAAIFTALARGKTAYYTAPLKALVSEKFFELVTIFGANNVGMQTGDSSINAEAPIVCATAEIVANIALREGSSAQVDVLIADEFHYYGDYQRGWAWQVPLLELPHTQHVMLSATLGDTTHLRADLTKRTGREVAVVDNAERPVPLSFFYSMEPLAELIPELIQTHRSPVYIVHFSQRDAVEQAQSLLPIALASKEEKEAIAQALGDFRFSAGFGKVLSKLLRNGIGVHHAGLLPRYRRLVERLAQAGLLKVICGTDTLGVGINVPIRTVVFTALSKFDGTRSRHVSAREFHQIAGRAGRAGFDTMGDFIVQGPEYEIENARAVKKAADDPKKLKKLVRKKAPEGVVLWSEKTFTHLQSAPPEKLESHMIMSHSLVINMLQRGEGTAPIHAMIEACHNADKQALHERAAEIVESLVAADVLVRTDKEWFETRTNEYPEETAYQRECAWREAGNTGKDVRFGRDIPYDFALNQPLAPFALAALEILDVESSDYALDVISVMESVQENPSPVLLAQEKKARGDAIGRMKASGMSYEERMAEADAITYPKPLEEELSAALEIYRQANPWVSDYELSPKSIVRDMIERAQTFSEFISAYDASRSEGVVLRYLTDTYKALQQSVPEFARTSELDDMTAWLGRLVRSVDSSLLDEWEALRDSQNGEALTTLHAAEASGGEDEQAFGVDAEGNLILARNLPALRRTIRNQAFALLEALEREDYDALDASATPPLWDGATVWDGDAWADATDPYFDEYEHIGIDMQARSAQFFTLIETPEVADFIQAGFPEECVPDMGDLWLVKQVFDDGQGDATWGFWACVDMNTIRQDNIVRLHVLHVGEFMR